jgi:hypothetical protein
VARRVDGLDPTLEEKWRQDRIRPHGLGSYNSPAGGQTSDSPRDAYDPHDEQADAGIKQHAIHHMSTGGRPRLKEGAASRLSVPGRFARLASIARPRRADLIAVAMDLRPSATSPAMKPAGRGLKGPVVAGKARLPHAGRRGR